MKKNINEDNEWSKALRRGEVEFDKDWKPRPAKRRSWEVSNKQRRGVRNTNANL